MKEVPLFVQIMAPGLYMKEVPCTINGTRSVYERSDMYKLMAPGLYMKEVICTNNGTRSVYERSAVYN